MNTAMEVQIVLMVNAGASLCTSNLQPKGSMKHYDIFLQFRFLHAAGQHFFYRNPDELL